MADENIITRFSTIGKSQTIADFAAVQAAENSLLAVIESSGVRQRTVYDQVALAAEQSARRQEEAAKRVEQLQQRAASQLRDVSGRFIRDPSTSGALAQLAAQYKNTATEAERAATVINAAADRQAATIQRNTQLQAQFNAALSAQQARLSVVGQRTAPLQSNIGAFTGIGNVAGSSTTKQLEEQRANLDRLRASAKGVTDQTTQLEQANLKKTKSIKDQTSAEDEAQRKGITYLSTLSAIHAASFLVGGQTFSNVGSLTVLGAAFSRVGALASVAGVGFGVVLLGVQSVTNAAQQTAERLNLIAAAMGGVTVATLSMAAAVTQSGVQLAGAVERPLALLQALGGATIGQLQETEGQVGKLALEFGISAADIVEAANLFVFAGGSIEAANEGAVRSILNLVTASKGTLAAAEAAKLVAVTMNQFNLTGKDTARIADVITAAVQNSALTFTSFAQGFQQAVPGAVTLGLSLEELAAIVGVLGNELQGTVAGTAFKQFLLDLINPTPKAITALESIGLTARFAFDELGEGRPSVDIVRDLAEALQGVSTQQRSEALAQIFESRAGLAGNILSRPDIVENLNKLFDAMERTSAAEVAARSIATLEGQVKRLDVASQELRRSLGGPLLGPLAAIAKQTADFFGSLTPQAQLAGEMLATVLGGQGFGELQQRIQDVTGDPALSTFFTRIVELGLQVRQVVLGQIVPALGAFAEAVLGIANEEGRVADINERFDQASIVIARLGNFITGLIGGLSKLVQEFVNGTGAGGDFRQRLSDIASAITSNLLAALVQVPITIAVGIVAFQGFARATLFLTETFIKFGGVAAFTLNFLGELLNAVIRPFATLLGIGKGLGQLGDALIKLQKGDLTGIQDISTAFETLGGTIKDTFSTQRNFFHDLADTTKEATGFASGLVDEFRGANANIGDIANNIKKTVGEIPNAFANLTQEIEKIESAAERPRGGGTTGGGTPVIDRQAVERAQQQVEELGQDLARRLSNINEDVAQRNTQIVESALERIDDVFGVAAKKIADIRRETDRQIDDLEQDVIQRREDRGRTEDLQEQLNDSLRITERFFDQLGTLDQRFREDVRTDRQRDNDDVARAFQQQLDIAERSYKQQSEAAERAFKQQQDAREKQLDRQQDAESKALQNQLDNQAAARQLQQQLATAKTPEERQRIQQQASQAAQDRAFERSQQSQLDALRARHEEQRNQLSRQQEEQQIAFRRSLETADIAFRTQQENQLLRFRRRAEDRERDVRRQEEDSDLVRRLAREDVLAEFRKAQEQTLQDFRDKLEDEALGRRILRIRAEQRIKEQDIERDAALRADELITDADRQIAQNVIAAIRQVRSVTDTLGDRTEDFVKKAGTDAIPGLSELIARVRGGAGVALGTAGDIANQSRQALRDAVAARQAQFQVETAVPIVQAQPQPIQQVPTQVLAVIPPTLGPVLEAAFIGGLVAAKAQGILPTQQINIQTGITQDQIIQILQEQLTPGITRR